MKNKPNNRSQVRITSKKTGKERLSAPMPVYNSKEQQDAVSEESVVASTTEPVKADPALSVQGHNEGQDMSTTSEAVAESAGNDDSKNRKKSLTGSKPKPDIETLEEFISYAFRSKGRPLKLSPKSERLIAQNSSRLNEMGMTSLLDTLEVDANTQLAVLRQLLFFGLEVQGFPGLRGNINKFVLLAMLRHPAFADAGVQAVLKNFPHAISHREALKHVLGYKPPISASEKEDIKPIELQALRQKAVQLLTIWLAIDRNLRPEEVSKLLFDTVWAPAARELENDNNRIRALIEIEHTAGVGFACEKLHQNTRDAEIAKNQAEQKALALSESLEKLQLQLQQTELDRDALAEELNALKISSANELKQAHDEHEVERIHLQHNEKQLRGKLVHQLNGSIDMLEVGLSALRNKTPRIEVMMERAEYVIDALRAEVSNLKRE